MTMKVSAKIFALLAFFVLVASAQNRTPQTHTRSMIHQTVYNTGELGRAFDGGQTGMTVGFSSMEWPPNSRIIINKREYEGQHNSMGGGFYLAGTLDGTRQTVACGAVASAGNGQTVPVAGVYSFPGIDHPDRKLSGIVRRNVESCVQSQRSRRDHCGDVDNPPQHFCDANEQGVEFSRIQLFHHL